MLAVNSEISARRLQSRMLLQVHDELVFEVAPGERESLEEVVVDKMSHAAQLRVPLDVQVGFGSNWDDAAH
jgi:DNA polymerase-1